MNEPIGRRGSLIPARARMHGVGDQLHRLVLADHPLVEDLVEAQQLLALALDQAGHRDAGPARDDLGDLLLGDLLAQELAAARLLLGELRLLLPELRLELRQLAVAQLGALVEVVLPLGRLDLLAHLLDLLAQARAPPRSTAFSASHCARMASAWALRSASSRRRSSSRSWLALSFSFLSAASSISSCITRRVTSSSSCGIESISVRIMAHASSIRSIALSGRKRSVM